MSCDGHYYMISKYLHVRDNVMFDHQVASSVIPEKNYTNCNDIYGEFLKVAVLI